MKTFVAIIGAQNVADPSFIDNWINICKTCVIFSFKMVYISKCVDIVLLKQF